MSLKIGCFCDLEDYFRPQKGAYTVLCYPATGNHIQMALSPPFSSGCKLFPGSWTWLEAAM